MNKKGKKKEKKNENKKELKDIIIDEAVKQFKEGNLRSGLDVENFLGDLLQPLMQKLLDTELENHLKYPKYTHVKEKETRNMRNGYCSPKTVKTKYGNILVRTPRDRDGTFRPLIIEKGQTKLDGFEEKCIALYAKGVSLRDIEKTLKELYGVKIGKDEISKLISAVSEETEKWRKRPLKSMYVFTYADCLYIPIKEDIVSEKKAIYVIIGVDVEGKKDILYMTSDGVAGFKGSLEEVFPKTHAQRCVVHLVRNLYGICPQKSKKQIIKDFKEIYTSSNIEDAKLHLEDFKNKYEENKRIVNKVESFMKYLEPLFELPQEIRKCIYTSNAIESVNSALRKVTRGKGSFPSENSVYKILYLRIKELKEKWTKPIQNWKTIQLQLVELFGKRYTNHIKI